MLNAVQNFALLFSAAFVIITVILWTSAKYRRQQGTTLATIKIVNGRLHSTTGPALVTENGTELYYVNGMQWGVDKFNEKYGQ